MAEFENQPLAPVTSKELIEECSNFIRPDRPSRCTWKPQLDTKLAPHVFKVHYEKPKILANVLEAVGNTPLIRLNKIPKSFGIECEILAKCEFFNPAGSVKDRIAIRMVEDAERRGLLKPGDTIIEPTSGNTGLGLAMAAAVKGYRCVIVMPLKMSNEKVNSLKALGAQIIRTPTSASFDSPEGLIAVAQKLCKEIPNSVILDQYRNSCNPIAHYENTAQEIINQCNGKLDVIVCGVGTGGTISGIGRKIKESLPNCKIIASDPLGSSLSLPEHLNKTDVTFYEVEGIGYDFIPTVLDRSVVDKWYKTNDKDSLIMARRLIKEEGLLCGGSSGSAMTVAIEVAKTMTKDQRLVVLLPDGMRNYLTKFVDETWMKTRGFANADDDHLWWSNLPVSILQLKTPPTTSFSVDCAVAIKHMNDANLDHIFIDKEGVIIGAVTKAKILINLTELKNNLFDKIEKLVEPVQVFEESTPLGRISCIIQQEKLVLIKGGSNCYNLKYATADDLLKYICDSLKN